MAGMFQPSQDDVRRFFCGAYAKSRGGALIAEPLSPLEVLAVRWIDRHPEWHADLADADAALAQDYSAERGRGNPFLHLSMHLTISEQVSIDQPAGIRQAFELLAAKHGEHEAHHRIMDCLGEMIWLSQRTQQPPDGQAYMECVRRKALG
jgi:hypothetical protein